MASNDGSRPEPQKPVDGQSTEIMSPQSMGDVAKPENPTKPISPVTSSAGPVPDASAEPSRESTTQLHAPNAYADWNALKETPTMTMPQGGQPTTAGGGVSMPDPAESAQQPSAYVPLANADQEPKAAEPKTKKPVIAIVFAVIYLLLALISDGSTLSVSLIVVFAILPALFSGLAFLDTRESPKSKKRIYTYIAIGITVLSIVIMGGKMVAEDMHQKALEEEDETSLSSDSSKSDNNTDKDTDGDADSDSKDADTNEQDQQQSQNTQDPQDSQQAQQPQQQQPQQGNASQVDPNFKATMDSYEQFFDQYVDFMKKYKDSNYSADMLVDYTKMMQQYSDTMTKMDSIDQSTLSSADDAYYLEVLGRVTQKLASVQ